MFYFIALHLPQPGSELDDFALANIYDPSSGTIIQFLRHHFTQMAFFEQQQTLLFFQTCNEFVSLHGTSSHRPPKSLTPAQLSKR